MAPTLLRCTSILRFGAAMMFSTFTTGSGTYTCTVGVPLSKARRESDAASRAFVLPFVAAASGTTTPCVSEPLRKLSRMSAVMKS